MEEISLKRPDQSAFCGNSSVNVQTNAQIHKIHKYAN